MENDEGEDNLYDAILSWASCVIVERTTYVKVLPARNDDLTYYLIIHVLRCSAVSLVSRFVAISTVGSADTFLYEYHRLLNCLQ
jgi:hypothetical protein